MFRPCCLPILIGSLPVTSHSEAASLILRYAPEIPLWPQLPKNHGEGMVRQFLSGFPGLVDDGPRFWIDTSHENFANEMTEFYTEYMAADEDTDLLLSSRFRLSNDTAAGFAALIDLISSNGHKLYTLKGQVTGPITTGTGTKDQNGNSIIYDDNLRDMLIKHLSLKGRWQAIELGKYTPKTKPIIFIDEPAMVSFGSTGFAGISKEMVTEAVSEVILSIQQVGGLAGVHICANGDWAPALDSGADIISFDAYSYFDNFILFRDQLTRFLKEGGMLAWGIIPTADPLIVAEETADDLFNRWLDQLDVLCGFGIPASKIMEQTFIAPACGTGSLPLELALKVLAMNRDVSQKCKEHLSQLTNQSP